MNVKGTRSVETAFKASPLNSCDAEDASSLLQGTLCKRSIVSGTQVPNNHTLTLVC